MFTVVFIPYIIQETFIKRKNNNVHIFIKCTSDIPLLNGFPCRVVVFGQVSDIEDATQNVNETIKSYDDAAKPAKKNPKGK